MEHDIRVERSGATATITLARPEVRNAMRLATCLEILHALETVSADPNARVLVISHDGPFFSAGGDLRGYTGRPQAAFREYTDAFRRLWLAMALFPCPIVARVSGHVLGGGIGVVAASDFVVSSEAATYRCSEIDVGLWPMMVSPILARTVGPKRALQLMMTGETLSAGEAKAIGLVSHVTAPSDVDMETWRLVDSLAAKSPFALAMGRRSFAVMSGMELSQAFEYTAEMLALLVFSHDGQEGIRAFFEKRKPIWKGH